MRYQLLPFLLFSLISTAICEEYSDYNQMAGFLREKQSRYRDIMSLESIAVSPGGRDIFVVTLAAGDAATNPAMLVVGTVEGIDLVASEMCLRFIDEVLRGYGKVDSITRLLGTTTLYVVPRVNPDASEFFFSTPRFESRLNARELDLDRDGLISEDGPDDLDGDGFITQMRIKDPLGEWLTCEEEPRLMIKSKRSEKTIDRYTMLVEGRDNDGDGLLNEDPGGGVDFNSNFSYNYKYFEKGAGPYQLSENESRGLADFCYEHPNVALFFSF